MLCDAEFLALASVVADSDASALDRVEALASLLADSPDPVAPEVIALQALAVDHLQECLGIVRKQPFDAPAIGFDAFWSHVGAMVSAGGVAFADDVVAGVDVEVAAARHGVDAVGRQTASAYARLVQPVVRAVEVFELLQPRRLPVPLVDIDEGQWRLVDTAPPARRRTFGSSSNPSEQARPGHGWPVTSLAPPVAA